MKSAHTSIRCILVMSIHQSYLAGGAACSATLSKPTLMHKYLYGISEAYGRAIGTNFGFSSIAQSPPPEPELPLPQRRSGALAREGGKRAKLAKPSLRTSGSSMLVANQHEDPLRSARQCQDTSKRLPGQLRDFQIDLHEHPKSTCKKHPNG